MAEASNTEYAAASQTVVNLYRGNVDVTDPSDRNPEARLISIMGWTVLLLHIVGAPPKIDPTAAMLIQQHQPDIVVFGHSHRSAVTQHNGVLYINPGSAGAS